MGWSTGDVMVIGDVMVMVLVAAKVGEVLV